MRRRRKPSELRNRPRRPRWRRTPQARRVGQRRRPLPPMPAARPRRSRTPPWRKAPRAPIASMRLACRLRALLRQPPEAPARQPPNRSPQTFPRASRHKVPPAARRGRTSQLPPPARSHSRLAARRQRSVPAARQAQRRRRKRPWWPKQEVRPRRRLARKPRQLLVPRALFSFQEPAPDRASRSRVNRSTRPQVRPRSRNGQRPPATRASPHARPAQARSSGAKGWPLR